MGRVIGKAICDGQVMDVFFTRSFYKHILGLPILSQDLEAVDPAFYKGLKFLLDNKIDSLDLGVTFSADREVFGKVIAYDLKPNGSNIDVTDKNKHEYVELITHFRMTEAIKDQIQAFRKGFHELIPQDLIAVFNDNELELLISGMPNIDFDDLKNNTEYEGFKPSDSTIQWFWQALNSFSQEEKAMFLQFVTGTSKGK